VRLKPIADRTRPRATDEERAQDRLQNPITVRLYRSCLAESNGENSRAKGQNVREESSAYIRAQEAEDEQGAPNIQALRTD
jgi:hypothetical protein